MMGNAQSESAHYQVAMISCSSILDAAMPGRQQMHEDLGLD